MVGEVGLASDTLSLGEVRIVEELKKEHQLISDLLDGGNVIDVFS